MKDQEVIDFGWDNYLKEMDEKLDHVNVGILSKDGAEGKFPLARLASVHEFGAIISHPNGAEIVIPSRPFMRGTFDEQLEQLAKSADRLESQVLTRKMTKQSALSELGQMHRQQIQKNIGTKGKYEANKPSTIRRKGSSNELVDTGRLRQSIDFEVG